MEIPVQRVLMDMHLKNNFRCKSVSYCSVACSETYWPEHRSSCSKEKEKKQMRRRQKEKIATEVD